MSESLPAINIDQLTSAVNAVVNIKNVEPPSSCGVKPVRSIAPHTTSSTSYTHNTSSVISSNSQNLNLTSGNLPLMVSVQLTSSNGDTTGTPLCIQQGTSNYTCNKMTSLQNIQPTSATIPLPLISLQDSGVNTSSQTLVDLHNIHPSNPLPPFTTQTFSSQTELSHHDINCSETSISDNTVCSYNQSSCSIGQLTSQELLAIPTSSVGLYQMNTSSTANQHVLPNLIFSPSEVSTALRFFTTSPLPILSVSEKDTPISSTSHYSPRPLSVASNISGISVIDASLKPQDNVQFLAPLPPLSVDKPVSIVKPVTDLSKRLPALPAYYCVECAHTHYSPCKHHTCDYLNITDTPVLSRARQSLPSCLQLQFSKITGHFNDAGVITTTSISVMTQFGPLIGKSVRDSTDKDVHIFKHWKIFYTLDNEYQCDVLDISDENYSNWLMFVKPARSSTEQNLVAYQCNDSIMFVTCKDIEPDSELLFWYSKEYAKLLGFMTKPNRINYCPYCFQCDKIFPDKKSLLEHKKSEHSESTFRKHQCQYCHKRFATTGKLNTHIVARHMQLKPFTCNQCGKQFSDQSNLRIHKAIHTGVKKFTCDLCKKSFRQKAHLTSHILTHTKEKSVDCPHCDKKFARVSDMKQHQYNHTHEKVFQCAQCNKIFYKLQNYKKHMKIHTNERNYPCPSCQKSFYTNYHLQRHIKTCKRTKMADMVMQLNADELYNRRNGINSMVNNTLSTCGTGNSEMYSTVQLADDTRHDLNQTTV
ncbi:hypothetical protein SNE40_018661 [Patella caerulea]|uniref:PR domain zinc finger protein 4 n=1 Tax=Patella caerulea TaxID=87958 RepID=A0AAN8J5U5_PATCE